MRDTHSDCCLCLLLKCADAAHDLTKSMSAVIATEQWCMPAPVT